MKLIDNSDILLTTAQCGQVLRVSTNTIIRWVDKGQLPASCITTRPDFKGKFRYRRVLLKDLMAFATENDMFVDVDQLEIVKAKADARYGTSSVDREPGKAAPLLSKRAKRALQALKEA